PRIEKVMSGEPRGSCAVRARLANLLVYVKRNKHDVAEAEAICEAVRCPSMRFVSIKTAEQHSALMMHRVRDLLNRLGLCLPSGPSQPNFALASVQVMSFSSCRPRNARTCPASTGRPMKYPWTSSQWDWRRNLSCSATT